jgi:branched-subunit amino acid transport protein
VFSLVSAAGLYVVFLVIALVATGGVLGARGAGALLSPYLIAGIVTGAVAWSVRSRWPIWLYPSVVLGIAIGFTVLSSIGRIAPSN